MDRMRESLFAILGGIEGLSFLDMFSGSGVVAIEAASRGCRRVTLVEKDFRKKEVIQKNLRMVEEETKLYIMGAEQFLRRISPREGGFDIVYLDPPFNRAGKSALLGDTLRSGALKPGGLVILHYPREEGEPGDGNLICEDLRHYGRSCLAFYRRREDSALTGLLSPEQGGIAL
jgi:16S rRNA (guanine(966)-N(2))-methyltransferase RsmD